MEKDFMSMNKNKMITYVLMLSTQFPSYHIRAGQPTNFIDSIQNKTKIHTIRTNYELWKKRFKKIDQGLAVLSVRYWKGIPYKSNQIESFVFDKSDGIGIEKILFYDYLYSCQIEDVGFSVSGLMIQLNFLYDFSKPMAIIHFTKYRYK